MGAKKRLYRSATRFNLAILCMNLYLTGRVLLETRSVEISGMFVLMVILPFSLVLLSINLLIFQANVSQLLCSVQSFLSVLFFLNGYLPDGKYPNHLREMTLDGILEYTDQILCNQSFWEELPKEVPSEDELGSRLAMAGFLGCGVNQARDTLGRLKTELEDYAKLKERLASIVS